MNQKNTVYIILGTIFLFVFLYGVYVLTNKNSPPPKKTDEIILYWSKTCEHCKKVEDYLKSHPNIEKKIKIERKEIGDRKNADDLGNKALICQYNSVNGIPIPFLYFKGQCTVGDKPIIDYLNKKAL